ncbi:MAG TPA: TIM-barrel domain-containing protein, partial [Actinotalea sp.]|nr:TIM-barrel domain-containing protein [Actinotalea sp.]
MSTPSQGPATTAPGPVADPRAVVQGAGYRITVLTSRMVRLERSEDGSFVDEPTQVVVNRRFPVPEFRVATEPGALDLWTEHLHVHYDTGPFSPAGLSVTLLRSARSAHQTTWRFGDPQTVDPAGNLGGTTRTLDEVDGAAPLDPGLLSTPGYAVVDDSASLLLTADGWVAPRTGQGHDLYVLGYGTEHHAALRDWFALTGPSPLLPRWTLGNWWSRYHRYSGEEYLGLMDRFAAAGMPFSVAVIDMDWHLVDIDPALGTGWTGYTWNRELFADPPAFLAALHERGLHTTLNVHPADGVRRHEEAYPAVARELGLDPGEGLAVAFDIGSRRFVEAYLRHLHHPLEDAGVDFWWLDWQSGTASRWPGLDPLWMLNHVHYLDSGRGGRRPLTFFRYAGLGSHRYPIGFSGDTVISWASLAFQPGFTATAANVGYFWWSHDVGGHFFGVKDVELATRWVQLGALSPVNRLHSSNNPFTSKEPWRFGRQAEAIMRRYLRLRHQLVPYLYSAMWTAHTDGVGPVRPMYHDHPLEPAAYTVAHQYLLGPDLVVVPVTSPADRQTHLAQTEAWLPEGVWVDLLTGRRYRGGRSLRLHRTLADVPVLARAGTVLPLAADPMADPGADPVALVLRVVPGADGGCVLLEDGGGGEVTVA